MRKLGLLTLLLAASVAAFADGNGNGNSTTLTTTFSIQVVTPIQVTRVSDLNFGSLVIDPATFTPGAMTVGTDNLLNINALGAGTWKFTGSGHATPSAAQFKVTGENGYPFGFAALDFTLLHSSGSRMRVTPLIAMVDTVTHGTVPATIPVGGTLFLTGDAKPGVWTGTFDVTAIYL